MEIFIVNKMIIFFVNIFANIFANSRALFIERNKN